MRSRHIAVVGAGPGGLTSAMILAHRGYRVSVFERNPWVGGRNAPIHLGPYTFDTGPTFLMATFILEEAFADAGRKLADYVTVQRLDPMYRLSFAGAELDATTDPEKMQEQIDRVFPGNSGAVERFHARERVRFDRMYPCLRKDYSTLGSLFCLPLLKALPHLALGKSLYQVLASYFTQEDLRIAFSFQSKYLGMSPWKCPGAFTIIPYIEHAFGVDHVRGGLYRISEAMAAVAREQQAAIHLSTPVRRITVRDGKARGLELENGEKVEADAVVIDADFGHAVTHLFDPGVIRRWAEPRLRRKAFSCSTFMLYLGVDKTYDEPFHNILFAKDYRGNIADISQHLRVPQDMSVYVRNASRLDPSLAPPGHSALYVLVPVPNNTSGIRWDKERVADYRAKVLRRIEERTSMRDLSSRIVAERVITPDDWEQEHNVFLGATFNLGHTLTQMLYFRPRNRFEEVGNCFLVGGGTHPGSGLPTIYESGRISSNLITRQWQ